MKDLNTGPSEFSLQFPYFLPTLPPFALLFCSLTGFAGHSKVTGRRGGLMVSALDSGSSGPGSGPGRGHCVVFLGKTLYSHGASLHPGV